jgi:hypothetical protein
MNVNGFPVLFSLKAVFVLSVAILYKRLEYVCIATCVLHAGNRRYIMIMAFLPTFVKAAKCTFCIDQKDVALRSYSVYPACVYAGIFIASYKWQVDP